MIPLCFQGKAGLALAASCSPCSASLVGIHSERQQAQAEAQKIPPEHEEELPYCVGQIAQRGVQSSSSETVKNLDEILGPGMVLPEQRAWSRCPTVVPSILSHSGIL